MTFISATQPYTTELGIRRGSYISLQCIKTTLIWAWFPWIYQIKAIQMPEHQRTAWDGLSVVKPQGHDLGGECWTTHTKAPSEPEHKHGASRELGPELLQEHNMAKEKQQPGLWGRTTTLQCCTLTQFSEVTLNWLWNGQNFQWRADNADAEFAWVHWTPLENTLCQPVCYYPEWESSSCLCTEG